MRYELKYGCNPNQKPSRIFMKAGELPLTVLNGKPGYINFLDALNGWQLVRELKRATGLPALADDSGLSVDALGGAPGVYSARYAGEHGNDQKNNALLLKNLQAVPAQQRTARFVSSVCCVFPDGRQLTVRGACEGTIAFEPRGGGGFGYDPLFLVGGKTFGELTAQEKDRVSHRGNALRKLAQELPAYLETGKDHL